MARRLTVPVRSDAEANRLAEDNIGLLWFFIRKNRNRPIDRDDLVSAAMYAFVRSSRFYDGSRGASFASYSYRWMGSAVASFIRQQKRNGRSRPAYSILAGDKHNDVVWRGPGPLTAACDSETLEMVSAAMAEVPPRNREITRNHICEGRTLREIGEREGISAERVRQIVAGAIRKARDSISAPNPSHPTHRTYDARHHGNPTQRRTRKRSCR